MTVEDFVQLLNANTCPDSISPHLQALWYDAKGNWNQAHTIVQRLRDQNAARIHAYLHRKEGDLQNSRYWYNKVESTFSEKLSFDEEWHWLVDRSLIK